LLLFNKKDIVALKNVGQEPREIRNILVWGNIHGEKRDQATRGETKREN
jgi:hypothetical protein